MIDVQQKKDKIISFIENNGPSLPVRIAKIIEMDPMFASAILSELLNEKRVKTSNLRVGASALYYLPGQEQRLEEHTDNLKSIEKEAFLKLKSKKVLIDDDEEPATRVALRNIRDFAIPFKFQERIMWRYSFSPEEEIENIMNPSKKEDKKEVKEAKLSKKIKEETIQKEEKIQWLY